MSPMVGCNLLSPDTCLVVLVSIDYDAGSVAALRNFADANRKLADQLSVQGGSADVYITFRDYVPPDRFRDWAKAMGLSVKKSELRIVGANGQPAIIGIQAGRATDPPNDPLPQTDLDYQISAVRAQNEATHKFPAVYFTHATVAAQQLPTLAADPLVFLADVTPTIVRNDLLAAGFTTEDWERAQFMNSHTPFLAMEQYGLENFK
jgi:hypothetical protein